MNKKNCVYNKYLYFSNLLFAITNNNKQNLSKEYNYFLLNRFCLLCFKLKMHFTLEVQFDNRMTFILIYINTTKNNVFKDLLMKSNYLFLFSPMLNLMFTQ